MFDSNELSKVSQTTIMRYYSDKPGIGTTISLAAALVAFMASAHAQQLFTKPEWLPELGLGLTESYDDNLAGVSGHGLQPMQSWIGTVSPRIGFDLAPVFANQTVLQALSVKYAPDLYVFHDAAGIELRRPQIQYGHQGRRRRLFALAEQFISL